MRHEAEDFCDQKLAGMEIVLDRLTRTVQSGRAKLASPPPPPPPPQVGHTPGSGNGSGTRSGTRSGTGPEEDGFFDQDVS